MSGSPDWLPPLMLLTDYNGDWGNYLEAIYRAFCADFVHAMPMATGKPCGLRHPELIEGKQGTFWHIISEGKIEEERLPDLRRCERIRWPRPIIEAAGDNRVRCWRQRRNRGPRIIIALEDFSYVVVLLDRKSYALLLTAFPVDRDRRREKLREDYENSSKKLTPPKTGGAGTPSTRGG